VDRIRTSRGVGEARPCARWRSCRLAKPLIRAADAEVPVHDDLFPQEAKDEVWLAEVARRGWFVPTKDKHIRSPVSDKLVLPGLSSTAAEFERE
jgi:hypothetical protein